MDQPTDTDKNKSKIINFNDFRKRFLDKPGSSTFNGKTPEQRVLDLELDVGKLVVTVVDMASHIEAQAKLLNLLVKAVTHMDAKLRKGEY